jgi:FHA domain-containing protein
MKGTRKSHSNAMATTSNDAVRPVHASEKGSYFSPDPKDLVTILLAGCLACFCTYPQSTMALKRAPRKKAHMITISVLSFGEAALASPLSATFDELGGHIGRSESNQLVLPDPHRSISRVHAQVVFRAGRYFVIDRGSNPITHNSRPLGHGQEAVLQPGDELQIGPYRLGVSAAAKGGAALKADPFADFAGLVAAPAAPPLAKQSPADALETPFKLAGHLGGAGGAIPADWDPFASNRAPVAAVVGSAALPTAVHTSSEDSLDTLFGLGPMSTGRDPLAGSVLKPAEAEPNMAAHDDPMKSLNLLPSLLIGSAAPDVSSVLSAPWVTTQPSALQNLDGADEEEPPMRTSSLFNPAAHKRAYALKSSAQKSDPASFDTAPVAYAQAVASPAAVKAAPVPIPDAVLSWEPSGQTSHTVVCSGSAENAAPQAFSSAVAADVNKRIPEPVSAAVPAAVERPAFSAALSEEALLNALRQGLGMPELPLRSLTPELMNLIGRLLHEATQGTVELLVARSALKREIRADVTIIQARENNPLKFSPSAEAALKHMLSPPSRGFIGPEAAFRDAFEDLRAHQLGFVAGLRAALEGLLDRFDPQQLETHMAAQRSMLANLVPAARKARLWDAYEQMYTQIAALAQDDFHSLFGKAFVQAYEAQRDQMESEACGAKNRRSTPSTL